MNFEKKENSKDRVSMLAESADATRDSPIDLSQLSTRCRNVDLANRSASESCLAPTAAVAAKKRRIQGFKDPLPPPAPLMVDHSAADSLKYRSMSHADIAGYRTPWLSSETTEFSSSRIASSSKTSTGAAPVEMPTAAAALSDAETLKFRCMSESRLAGPGKTALHPTAVLGNSSSAGRSRNLGATSNSDLLRAAADNSQLEFLLRRTHSESVLPSR